ncbi:MAG: hypothetical protein OEV25_01185 [Deltaproteobacteria bacterium]|nr:hypothetical protein [Deltaproteobacteria bacterium]MDH3928384.1 hypothetical protein [Deltaproteobacteria bacterium]MDH3962014.1 hypothetical protein [Deltaproteobacteria bacterium]
MKILISHISDEALIALLLKDFIESTFLGQFEVLLSSNSGDSGVGDKWLVELDGALTSADLLLVLCSPKSIRQPWIHFEFGCAWTKSLAINCLCHSGLNKIGLPSHLRIFEVLEVDDDNFMEQLFEDLAKRFGIRRLPRLSYDTMKAELRATLVSLSHTGKHDDAPIAIDDFKREPGFAEQEVEASEAAPVIAKELEEKIDERIEEKIREKEEPSKPEPSKPEPSKPEPQKPKPEKPRSSPGKKVKVKGLRRKKKEAPQETESVQKRVLKLLAAAGDTGYPLEDLSDLLGIVEPKLEPYLDVLKEQAYINIAVEVGRPPEYKIAAKGEQYLDESRPS